MTTASITQTFKQFVESEKFGGMLLILCTLLSIGLANSSFSPSYLFFWETNLLGMSLSHWINDGLMAIFFLLIGLELEREIYNGELSKPRQALLPLLAALGGIVVPASIHFYFNNGLATQAGMGIPMATDIAFALGVLALLGNRIPVGVKIFLTALAVADDLGAIIVIALFYTAKVHWTFLFGAAGVYALLLFFNLKLRIMALWPYLIGGALLWWLMLMSGVHATIAGVLLAFAIPFSARSDDHESPSHRLEHLIHKPVAFVIMPIFALANTGLVLTGLDLSHLINTNTLGIAAGLVIGKPLGIALFTFAALLLGWCKLPSDIHWKHVIGAGFLGGIGFTMSIFIANLAFADQIQIVNASKIAILVGSLIAGMIGYLWLLLAAPKPTRPSPNGI